MCKAQWFLYACTTCFNIHKLCVLPTECVFRITTINRLVFAVESKCVLCEVGTGFLGIVAVVVMHQGTQGARNM